MSSDDIQLIADTLSEEYESFLATIGFLDQNPLITAAVTGLAEGHAEIKANLAKIPSRVISRLASVKAVKRVSRLELADIINVVSSALRVIGRRRNIEVLKNLPPNIDKRLGRMRFDQMGQLCKALYDLMNANKISLVDIGIDDTQITTFKTAVMQYNEKKKKTKIPRCRRKVSIDEINKIFKDIAKTMDDIIETVDSLKNKYPAFYAGFNQVAQIREYGNRHRTAGTLPVALQAVNTQPQ